MISTDPGPPEPRMRTPLLAQAAVLAALLTLSSGLTGSHLCPRSLDCARVGRHFCPPGGWNCGPCLRPLVENSRGRCVVRRRPAHLLTAKVSANSELDEEIDFLSAVISEQQTESRLPDSQTSEHPSPASITNRSTDAPPTSHASALLSDPVIQPYTSNDNQFIVLSSIFIVASSLLLILAGACWVRLQRGVRLTQKVGGPLYGLVRAQTSDTMPGDRKLAHNAQMYHYQHQKQQMISMEKHRDSVPESGASTDEENDDGDFTVYECPGLAPTGEMEVKNPLFDDSTLYLQRFQN
ncbi:neural proliferation differentiation and control protein 1-like isoform X2 [Gouania willdenowi]|uniref:neural proliferation differentiation and control protein 1-like isoform X2 n=1 Tax=Gouania willdenowi TaxID=441366 RepID=UPI001056DBA0|nr:neural proliferation differentiation and control protein 1-like isoform X2 [Gouania willdenowi]